MRFFIYILEEKKNNIILFEISTTFYPTPTESLIYMLKNLKKIMLVF